MIYSTLKNIKCVVLDVDGVLTDGAILVNENGEQLRTFNVKDGYAIQYAIKQGLLIFVLTGGLSQGVLKRMEGLHVPEVHLGVSDKLRLLEELAARYNLRLADMAFIGDDMPDYSCMQQVGAAIAPADAVEDIKRISHYVSTKRGGEGIVREIIEKVLRLQNKWHTEVLIKSI
ncbi:KdsC family phosphatase [Sphingobacterium faecale]|uniref:HAD hydrolase family protein n=1 Tax=Sphingobacterium faecale TaxID=2803775 RepID=A0ABS1RBD6_9SPHI|nr:HAD hydrolase family protein [Sphingobacterium faecale]MBL1411322.1 HAD hydrolase family protein [Sphingobacterium faecale]